MSIKRLFDAVERRGDIGRRVAALVLPISNRARVTSSGAGKIGLREPGEHARGPNLPSRDNVAHNPTLYTILETPPPAHPALSKAGPDIRYQMFRCRSEPPAIPAALSPPQASPSDNHWGCEMRGPKRRLRSLRASIEANHARTIGRSPNSRESGRNSTNTSTGRQTATSAQPWRP